LERFVNRWILAAILAIGGIPVLFCFGLLVYELHGKSAFESWKAGRVAMGDRLDWKSLEPPAVASSDNFSEAPLIRGAILDRNQMEPRWKALAPPAGADPFWGDWNEGRRDDLMKLSQAYGAKDPWTALEPLAPALKELDEASRRGGNRLPIDYKEWQTPALLGFRGAVRTLRFRAIANLRSGKQCLALADVLTCLRVANHFEREPELLAALLRNAIVKSTMQVVWEGLEDHQWSPSQLERIQMELAKTNLLATMRTALQGERQHGIDFYSATAENQPPPKYSGNKDESPTHLGLLVRGWFYRNILVICQYHSMFVDSLDASGRRVHPSLIPEPGAWERRLRWRPDLVMARIPEPPTWNVWVTSCAQRQAFIDEAVIVCALERYRISQGRYPDRLESLATDFLPSMPVELVSGGPVHYRRQGESFLLYQVGWDGKDENGRIGWRGTGKDRAIDPAQGNWTWPHAS
jgi:hypothetical protein